MQGNDPGILSTLQLKPMGTINQHFNVYNTVRLLFYCYYIIIFIITYQFNNHLASSF